MPPLPPFTGCLPEETTALAHVCASVWASPSHCTWSFSISHTSDTGRAYCVALRDCSRCALLALLSCHSVSHTHLKSPCVKQLQQSGARLALRAAHDTWWREYWGASWVSLPFSRLLERYYYGSQYLLGVSSRAGHAAPGIFGPFITVENGGGGEPASPWGGDYHMNYNGDTLSILVPF
eukprot:COSAG03_NODE_254_length_9907_cov_43.112765_8_plen_179_part_00